MKTIKNVSLHIQANKWGNLWVNVSKTNRKGQFEHIGQYKMLYCIDNVDVKLYVPKGCRSEYIKISKIN